jgi:hypothetical protein
MEAHVAKRCSFDLVKTSVLLGETMKCGKISFGSHAKTPPDIERTSTDNQTQSSLTTRSSKLSFFTLI